MIPDETVDITSALPADSATIEILRPGGTVGTGWMVTFAGPGHPKSVAWINEQSRRNLRKAQQIEQAQVNGKKYKSEDRDPDDVKRENVGWIVSRIVDWTPVKVGDMVFKFDERSATELLMRPSMNWAMTQMVDFLADDKSFTNRSETA